MDQDAVDDGFMEALDVFEEVPDEDDDDDGLLGFGDDDDLEVGASAAVPIVEVVDKAQCTFTGHTQAVFSCAVTADGRLAATGAQDDMAYVWECSSGNVVFECSGHKDSVTEVHFNRTDQMLVTGDMSGMLQVWSVADHKLLWCNECDELEWSLWHPTIDNVLLASGQIGCIHMWQVPTATAHYKVLPSHGKSCTAGAMHPTDGKRLLAGYDDGLLKLWELKSTTVLWQFNTEVGVTSVALSADGVLMCVAPSAHLLKLADGKLCGRFINHAHRQQLQERQQQQPIEAVLFLPELGVCVTGAISGWVCVWDVIKQAVRHEASIDCAVTMIRRRGDAGRGQSGQVVVGGADGNIYVCDVRTGRLVETLTGHREVVLNLATAGDFAISTSEDCTAKVFQLPPADTVGQ